MIAVYRRVTVHDRGWWLGKPRARASRVRRGGNRSVKQTVDRENVSRLRVGSCSASAPPGQGGLPACSPRVTTFPQEECRSARGVSGGLPTPSRYSRGRPDLAVQQAIDNADRD